jgi:hypothetical protein
MVIHDMVIVDHMLRVMEGLSVSVAGVAPIIGRDR